MRRIWRRIHSIYYTSIHYTTRPCIKNSNSIKIIFFIIHVGIPKSLNLIEIAHKKNSLTRTRIKRIKWVHREILGNCRFKITNHLFFNSIIVSIQQRTESNLLGQPKKKKHVLHIYKFNN